MELIYVYDTSIGFGDNQINLSEDLNVSFRNDIISVEIADKKLPEVFWGNPRISSVTAFVGENGVGKSRIVCTSILKRQSEDSQSITVFREKERIEIYVSGKFRDSKIDSKLQYKVYDYNSDEYKAKSARVLYSNQISSNLNLDLSINRDFSTRTQFSLVNREKLSKQKLDSFELFLRNEIINQVKFLESDLAKDLQDFIDIDRDVDAGFDNKGTFYGNIFRSNFAGEIERKISGFNDHEVIFEHDLGKREFLGIFFLLLINYYRTDTLARNSTMILSSLSLEDELIPQIEKLDVNYLFGSIIHFLNFLDDNWGNITNKQVLKSSNSFDLTLNSIFFSIDKSIFNEFLFELEKVTGDNIGRLKFGFGVSTGEGALLSLYSRLYHNDFLRYEKKSILLVIDEGDSFFHPEWSRVFIRNLLTVVPAILKKAKSIQFILTTHSPFILSDIPHKSIKYLKKGAADPILFRKANPTFGANIHDLLCDSFFMKNGVVGEFARNKIKSLVKFLTNENIEYEHQQVLWNKESALDFIALVGEPLIKDRLSSLYRQKFASDSRENILKEIATLQNRLKNLGDD